MQIPNPLSMNSGGGRGTTVEGGGKKDNSKVISAIGKSFYDAGNNLTVKSTREINFTHTGITLFSEKLAREGLSPALDFLDRERQFRPISLAFVVDGGDLRKAMEAEFEMEEYGARGIRRHQQITVERNPVTIITALQEIYNWLSRPGQEIALPRLHLIDLSANGIGDGQDSGGDEELSMESPMQLSGLAAFKKDRLVGWLNEQEARGYALITNKAKRITYVIESPPPFKGNFTVEVFEIEAKKEAKVVDDQVTIIIKITAAGRIHETTSHEDWLSRDSQLIDSINKRLAEALRKDVQSALDKAQKKLQTDIFGFGNLIYRTLPREWEALAPQWDELYPVVEVQVDVNAEIRRTGLLRAPGRIR
ncbi:MAG: Ger(x)C family spore germination protein [Dethiobacteria bacterium]